MKKGIIKKSGEYTKGDVLNFIARGCLDMLSVILVDKGGKENMYDKAVVLDNSKAGKYSLDKVRVEFSSK